MKRWPIGLLLLLLSRALSAALIYRFSEKSFVPDEKELFGANYHSITLTKNFRLHQAGDLREII